MPIQFVVLLIPTANTRSSGYVAICIACASKWSLILSLALSNFVLLLVLVIMALFGGRGIIANAMALQILAVYLMHLGED